MAFSKLRAAWLGAAVGVAAMATPASAINIILRPDDSFTSAPSGAAALLSFQKAANYWNTIFTGDTEINVAISFRNLGNPNVIGQAGSNAYTESVSNVYAGLANSAATGLDAVAVANLRELSAAGGLGYRMPAPLVGNGVGTHIGLNASPTVGSVYDNDDTFNNRFMAPNSANARVLGLDFDNSQTFFGSAIDGEITFNSTFAFDYDPTNGISVGTQDFTSVALHEIGHVLGFVSGADTYDFYANPNGPGRTGPFGNTFDWDNGQFFPEFGVFITPDVLSVWDLFRASTGGGAGGFNPADGRRYLQLDPGRGAGFALDGVNFYNGNGSFSEYSTGQFNGDGRQASHWKDSPGFSLANGCFVAAIAQIGIMDPTSGSCQQGIVTANDLAAFDAMGYNVDLDLLNNRTYNFNTADVFALDGLAAVPEPATWAMLIGGIGVVGGAMRRRRAKVTRVSFG